MNALKPYRDPDTAVALIRCEARPVSPADGDKNLPAPFFRRVLAVIKGYTAEDISRLKEGGVLKVEGEGRKAIAEAQLKVAEAGKLNAEAEAIRLRARGQYAKDVAEAVGRVTDAIESIKAQGGVVAFDVQELVERLMLAETSSTGQGACGSPPNPGPNALLG